MRLPSILDLSKEQSFITDLPPNGKFLITGPAGSGKTVMALYRVWTLVMQGREPVLMTFSRPLKNYCLIAAERLDLGSSVMTFHEWFSAYWKKRFNQSPPRGEEKFTFDWNAILMHLGKVGDVKVEIPDLVVDEGQDLPREFYLVATLIAENITVFADENQRISGHQSTLAEIKGFLGAETAHRTVDVNARNTIEIARFAGIFADEKLPIPDRHGKDPELHWCSSAKDIVDRVVKHLKANPQHEVAVTAQQQQTVLGLWMELGRRKVSSAQVYVRRGGVPARLDFAKRGVKLLTSKAMKGLEFDTVFVADLETYPLDATDHAARMQMYVLATRAREELHLLYRGTEEPAIVSQVSYATLRRSI